MSVRTARFNPVLWLTTATCAPGTTAPLGSVMAPKTVASWVCAHAHAENKANDRTNRRRGLSPRINEGSSQGDKRAIILVVIGLTRSALAQLLGARIDFKQGDTLGGHSLCSVAEFHTS